MILNASKYLIKKILLEFINDFIITNYSVENKYTFILVSLLSFKFLIE